MIKIIQFCCGFLLLLVAGCVKSAPDNGIAAVKFENSLAASQFRSSLNSGDMALAVQGELKALKYGRPGVVETWQNPNTKNFGEIVAGQPYKIGGRDCRRYQHIIHVNGLEKRANGTACHNDEGFWQGLE